MKNTGLQFLAFAFFIALLGSCSSGKYPGFKEGDNGVYYKVHYRGNGETPVSDSDWVLVKMDYRLSDTVLFTSKNMDEDLVFAMIKPLFVGDLYQGLQMMKEGDSMSFAIVADSFFLKTANMKSLPDFVNPGDPMFYDVKLIDRMTNQEHKVYLENIAAEKRHVEAFKLKAYLDKNNIAEKPLPSGLIFIPLEEGYGKKPDTGEMCMVHLKVEVLDGDLLFVNFDKDPIDIEYGKDFDTKGLMEGLGMLRVGGKARLIVPSSIGVGASGKEVVPGFTTIVYEVQLDKLRSVEEVKKERAIKRKEKEAELNRLKEIEPERIKKYLDENNYTQEPSETGLYVIDLIKGEGNLPVNGDVVKLHYALFTIEGKKIDSSYDKGEPIIVTLGQGQVIRGWEEGIRKIHEGGKARLIVPSKLAYGRGYKGEITPYSPLIFDIELLEIITE